MDSIYDHIDREMNHTLARTENGGLGYETTGKKALLDLLWRVPSMRGCGVGEMDWDLINKAFDEDPVLFMRFLFYLRDVRHGLGERDTFRVILARLLNDKKVVITYEILRQLCMLIPQYGRWDDVIDLYFRLDVRLDAKEERIKFFIRYFLLNQLTQDFKDSMDQKPVSLLAKWMPSVNASSDETVSRAKHFIKAWCFDDAHYRKMLAHLREYIDVTEVKMCAGQWDEIDYSAVPSNANIRYRTAFMRHDKVRRAEYLQALGEGEAKINGAVNFPYQILHGYSPYFLVYEDAEKGIYKDGITAQIPEDATLEALWKALPGLAKADSKTMCVVDTSGSMGKWVRGDNVSALEVALSLAFYFSERMVGPMKDKFITFSDSPRLVDLSAFHSLHDKIDGMPVIYANTNIEAMFNMLYDTYVDQHLSPEDMPDSILIISDMEFDAGTACADRNVFEYEQHKFKEIGLCLPRLIFWNVNSRTNTVPVRENERGVTLIGGFSANLFDMVMNGETDPWQCLLKTLHSPRYDDVDKITLLTL